MYRRNIKHILGPLAVLIGIFIFYQTWLKPHYFHETPTPPPQVIVEEVSPASTAPVGPSQERSAPRGETVEDHRPRQHSSSETFRVARSHS
jgi:hypothetical protein